MNYIIILIVAILQTFFGSLWHSPLLFGKFWMKVNGISDNISKDQIDEMSKKAMPYYGIQFIMTLITDFVLFFAIGSSFWYNIILVCFIFVGFMLPVYVQSEIWTKSKNSMKIKKILVVGGQIFISMLIAGVLFSLFKISTLPK